MEKERTSEIGDAHLLHSKTLGHFMYDTPLTIFFLNPNIETKIGLKEEEKKVSRKGARF